MDFQDSRICTTVNGTLVSYIEEVGPNKSESIFRRTTTLRNVKRSPAINQINTAVSTWYQTGKLNSYVVKMAKHSLYMTSLLKSPKYIYP